MSTHIGVHATSDKGSVVVKVVNRLTVEDGRHESLAPYHELEFAGGDSRITFYVRTDQLADIADALSQYQRPGVGVVPIQIGGPLQSRMAALSC